MKKKLGAVLLVVALALALGLVPAASVGASPGPGIASLWHLDEGTGATTSDSSGNANDGAITNATWASGKFGNALSFDGDGDYVQLPASNTILNTDTFSVEAWFKTSVNHPAYGGTEGRIVNLHRMGTASTAVSLYVEQGKIGLLYYTGSAHVFVKHTVNYHDGVWHHIAVTHDATTYRLYYDGSEVASQADAFGDFGTFPAYLGTYNSSERFFDGTIDEVRIWDEALTATQIAQSYALGTPQPPEGATVVELGEEWLEGGEFVIFTSSFYGLDQWHFWSEPPEPQPLDSIYIYIMSDDSVTISDVSLRNKPFTPKGSGADWRIIGSTGGTSIEVGVAYITSETAPSLRKDCKSIHFSLDLSTGDSVGVNAQFLPYD